MNFRFWVDMTIFPLLHQTLFKESPQNLGENGHIHPKGEKTGEFTIRLRISKNKKINKNSEIFVKKSGFFRKKFQKPEDKKIQKKDIFNFLSRTQNNQI